MLEFLHIHEMRNNLSRLSALVYFVGEHAIPWPELSTSIPTWAQLDYSKQ